ncbi:hypothetical protein MYP_4624 [Sporocytophaga myxococcoides]|uniref:Uncharacterized protein n=2 Tax=Sporocytophaga myxococcoides TaxID=153721 RepID=A0A098LLM9_9BACT|nr:hypothetical protein MYP_4624 [Sporocytophaga myxococcoides]
MPAPRKADYYLGCLDGSVFIDLNLSDDNRIYLRRISFDGYGCCSLNDVVNCLSIEDSLRFIKEFKKETLDDRAIASLVKELIKINKDHIWADAIEEYDLMEKE